MVGTITPARKSKDGINGTKWCFECGGYKSAATFGFASVAGIKKKSRYVCADCQDRVKAMRKAARARARAFA
jgi:hypothetical protein